MIFMKHPEYHSQEEFINRSGKLRELISQGIDPYPAHFIPSSTLGDLCKEWEGKEIGHSEEAGLGNTPFARIAGRLILFRAMGKNAFAHIQDETGKIQIMCNRELTQVEGFAPTAELTSLKWIEKKIDLGDIIGVEGHLFYTQKGELTLFAKKLTLLCKTLLPLPDKHSGLVDKGVRYRKRWLDLISNPDVVRTFQIRSRILAEIRAYLNTLGFMEVETAVLQNNYGGAEAKPFTTKLHALDQEMFLRISLELPLKQLLVGGFLKVFEMGKVFRNEGIDRTHNPEFTMLEGYSAYSDYNEIMTIVENLFEKIALSLFGTTKISYSAKEGEEVTIDVKAPWKRLSMKDSIRLYGGFSVDEMSLDEMRAILLKTGEVDPKKVISAPKGILIALFFETFVEKHLIEPHHITDHPIETTPLCKLHRDPLLRKEGIVERFETFIVGSEFCNAYTELNDPSLQRELLEAQSLKKAAGDEEAHPLNEEFIEAICQGMPPTGGFGIGIDRLVMLFTKAASIRDVLFFPLMRPEE